MCSASFAIFMLNVDEHLSEFRELFQKKTETIRIFHEIWTICCQIVQKIRDISEFEWILHHSIHFFNSVLQFTPSLQWWILHHSIHFFISLRKTVANFTSFADLLGPQPRGGRRRGRPLAAPPASRRRPRPRRRSRSLRAGAYGRFAKMEANELMTSDK